MTTNSRALNEQRILRISLYSVVFFVILALAFAILTNSDAILFDGIYSLISFSMALITLKVAKLAELPDDDQYHFGYTAMEPALNLFKSLIIIVACVFAMIGGLKRLFMGGTPAEYGLAVVYGAMAAAGCFAVAWFMYRRSRTYRSDLVRVDAQSWFIDGLLSSSVMIAFVIAWWLEKSAWSQYAPRVDPLLLIAIVLAALPIPAKIMIESLKEVLQRAPPDTTVDEIQERLLTSLRGVKTKHVELRVSKRGRKTYVLVHVVVAEHFEIDSVAHLDEIRRKSERDLKEWNPEIVIDMLFVQDMALAN
jgi:cation diffusion facilitator family transporter